MSKIAVVFWIKPEGVDQLIEDVLGGAYADYKPTVMTGPSWLTPPVVAEVVPPPTNIEGNTQA